MSLWVFSARSMRWGVIVPMAESSELQRVVQSCGSSCLAPHSERRVRTYLVHIFCETYYYLLKGNAKTEVQFTETFLEKPKNIYNTLPESGIKPVSRVPN